MGEVRKRLGAVKRRIVPTDEGDDLVQRVESMRQRIAVLEREVQENRELNRRLAELTDVVTELLIPLADRDDDSVHELLDKYRAQL
ncbi:DUF6752 domain-containing protein [Solicola gregarius]|uniref:DUF6752 domain-containing protein n=1 Tax=Solicola gregarius TaxID=2908642 RepID=A0AA46TJ26_9ACTN|nr:DUF6752 domain-containing protein [Solicola gregarius]UYM06156.1 hypothetical protein L0C25_03525 [Solicola gregarius]